MERDGHKAGSGQKRGSNGEAVRVAQRPSVALALAECQHHTATRDRRRPGRGREGARRSSRPSSG